MTTPWTPLLFQAIRLPPGLASIFPNMHISVCANPRDLPLRWWITARLGAGVSHWYIITSFASSSHARNDWSVSRGAEPSTFATS